MRIISSLLVICLLLAGCSSATPGGPALEPSNQITTEQQTVSTVDPEAASYLKTLILTETILYNCEVAIDTTGESARVMVHLDGNPMGSIFGEILMATIKCCHTVTEQFDFQISEVSIYDGNGKDAFIWKTKDLETGFFTDSTQSVAKNMALKDVLAYCGYPDAEFGIIDLENMP